MSNTFSPEDASPVAEYTKDPVNTLNEGPLPPEILAESREKAVKYATSPEAKANGMAAKDTEKIVESSFDEAKKLVGQRDNFTKAVFGKDLKIELPVVNDRVAVVESKNAIVGRIRGLAAEILSKPLEVSDCETVYTTHTFYIPEKVRSVDPNEALPLPRKDVILIDYFIKTEGPKRKSDEVSFSAEELNQLVKDIDYVFLNYPAAKASFLKNTGSAYTSNESIIRDYVKSQNHDYPGKKGNLLNGLIHDAVAFPDHANEKNANSFKKALKSLIETGEEQMYERITMPDGLLIDKEGKATGAVEVKAYTPAEIKTWIAALEKSYEDGSLNKEGTKGLMMPGDTGDKILSGLFVATGVERKGLQVFIEPEKEPEKKNSAAGMRLGLNVEGLRNFVDVLNSVPQTELGQPREVSKDEVDMETAEVTTSIWQQDVPIIIRLPQDVNNADIQKLGEMIEKFGYSNIAIQKLPFTYEEINMLGYEYYMNNYFSKHREEIIKKSEEIAPTSEFVKNNLLSQLSNKDNWVINGNGKK